MARQTGVLNIAGDYEESILRFANHLGTNVIRRKVFNVIYGRGTKPKSPKQILEKAGLDTKKSQQVTNALNELSKHNLVEKIPNNGEVPDGSRYLYAKVEAIRANKDKILKYADDSVAADKVATKRRPQASVPLPTLPKSRRALRGKKRLNVVFLTANPPTEDTLQIDREFALVQEELQRSIFRDQVTLSFRPAADLPAIVKSLNDVRPEIVHFSGHGDSAGLSMDNQSIDRPGYTELGYETLAKALDATDKPPKILVLNSCFGSSGKSALLNSVDVLISMQRSISDLAALAFAPKFYAALASGQSVQSAFKQARLIVEHVSISEEDVPEMFVRSDIDPSTLTLT